MPDFEFNGIHLLIVFVVAVVAFAAGVVMGYFVHDDMLHGAQGKDGEP